MARKPSSKFFAKAIPSRDGGGFLGQFSAPGLVPAYVNENGRPRTFSNELAAELAAARTLVEVLNSRQTATPRSSGYVRPSPETLSRAIEAANISVSEFARIYGANIKTVYKWLDGMQDIPHAVSVFIEMMQDEKTLEMITAVADQKMEEFESGQ